MAELSCTCRDHVRGICEFFELRFENVASANLLLFVLPYRQRWYQLLTPSTIDEEEVLLADLDTKLLLRIVELTHASAFGEGAESKLRGVRACKLNDLEPRDLVCGVFGRVAGGILVVRGYHLGRRLEAAFEALDKDRAKRARAQI